MSISQEQLEEWRALAEKATEGPWRYRPNEFDDWGYVRVSNGWPVAIGRAGHGINGNVHRTAGTDPYGDNSKFIAASRTAVPALIAEVERLREALRGLMAVMEHCSVTDGMCCCGDSMDKHPSPMFCGHSPIDHGQYAADQAYEVARAALPEEPADGE